MFTGIIQEIGKVVAFTGDQLTIHSQLLIKQLKPGDSIAVNGACMTVNRVNDTHFAVDVMLETKRRTNLGTLKRGDVLNLESPLTLDRGLGGHIVQGHIDDTGTIQVLSPQGNAVIMRVRVSKDLMKYIVEKGFIAVDGISLTVTNRRDDYFEVSLVEFTRSNSTLGIKKIGDMVNLEVDIIAKYVERFLLLNENVISYNKLQQYGYTE